MEALNYKLVPDKGWDCFSKHIQLADYLYDEIIPIVNQGKFQYLNLFAGCGVFEDNLNNSVFILFDDSKKKEKIIELRLSETQLNQPSSNSQLLKVVAEMIKTFRLEKISID